ncbi:MAG TPA: FMN-binding protein [Candidatus Limnocylindrales bacterium]|nr:FMN-binding protein [Candidatus Limnocylindrales bacterium]
MKKIMFGFVVVAVMAVILVAGCQSANVAQNVYNDGVFTAFSDATQRGYTRIDITIEDDTIIAAQAAGFDGLGLEKQDTYRYAPFLEAMEELPKRIVEQNSWDIDTVSDATTSSREARMATLRALQMARINPTNTAQFFDGTFMAVSEPVDLAGRGWSIAWVTIANDKITDVIIHDTTPERDDAGSVIPNQFVIKNVDAASPEFYPFPAYHEARVELAERFVAANSDTVDGFTGATNTSTNAMIAVARALEMARRK